MLIKNRDCDGGNEFWDHVEFVASNLQPNMTGQEIVERAFKNLTPERQHDILAKLGIHDEPCEIFGERTSQ
jgi:hypothetical protein